MLLQIKIFFFRLPKNMDAQNALSAIGAMKY
jgi:hypothetical protein